MMGSIPVISVVVPVYNVEPYLRRCLDSVLAQTLTNIEIICIDDKSPDNSYEILREYAATDGRIRILRNEKNGGLSYTRNRGLRHAKGKYVYFLDSDDVILPCCLEKAYAAAEGAEADIVVFGAVEKEEGKRDAFMAVCRELCGKVWDGRKLFVELKRTAQMNAPVPFKLWRKDFLEKFELHFYEGIYHEDELFYFSALMRAGSVVCIPDILYEYYRRSGSIMRQRFSFRHIESLVVVIDEIAKIGERGDFSEPVAAAIQSHLAVFYVEAERRMALVGLSKLPETSSLFDGRKLKLYKFIRNMAEQQYLYALSEEQCQYLRGFEHVLVYGAGIVAKKILPELLKNDIQNIELVVASKKENADSVCGIPVRELSGIHYPKETCVVVIAVGKRLMQEVKESLVSAGYENMMMFDMP